MSKRIVLFSQPSPEIFAKLSEVLFPKYLNDKVFAYMPANGADSDNDLYTKIWEEFANSNNAKFVFVDNSKRGDQALAEHKKILNSNILMITGGNTFTLLNHLRLSGLDNTIKQFWQKENVVLSGFSAGAIVLSPSIWVASMGDADTNEVGITDLMGLNIVDFEVWPHFEQSQRPQADEYKLSNQREIKLIGNDEVLVVDK